MSKVKTIFLFGNYSKPTSNKSSKTQVADFSHIKLLLATERLFLPTLFLLTGQYSNLEKLFIPVLRSDPISKRQKNLEKPEKTINFRHLNRQKAFSQQNAFEDILAWKSLKTLKGL